jgi:hypothetical protein
VLRNLKLETGRFNIFLASLLPFGFLRLRHCERSETIQFFAALLFAFRNFALRTSTLEERSKYRFEYLFILRYPS